MMKLVITENITLAGVVDASEGWFMPSGEEGVDQSDIIATLRKHQQTADAVLFGRRTFEEMRGYWPLQTDDQTGITECLNNVSKYVVSTTLKDPGWDQTIVLSGDLEDEVRRLKSEPGRDIVATGSIQLVHGLIALGLVYEYRLFVYPVVLGRGLRLFEDGTEVPELVLVGSQAFRSGVVLLQYVVHN
jgi:dihydrofolate reductase